MSIRRLISLVTASFLVSSCSGSQDSDTFIRFEVGNQNYQTTHATFSVSGLNRQDWKFVEIAKDVTRPDAFDPPSASLQWRMELADPMMLEGRTIAIRDLNDTEMADPLLNFVLPDDVSVANMTGTDASVTITEIAGGIVEGSFRSRNLDYLADGGQKTVDVTGKFRARLLD